MGVPDTDREEPFCARIWHFEAFVMRFAVTIGRMLGW